MQRLYKNKKSNFFGFITIALFSLTLVSGLILSSSSISAANNDTVVDKIKITVPVSCNLTGVGMNTHNATINNGTYASDIGTTTIKAFCNDKDGFAIYAIGYTDNEDHKNVLTNPTLGSSNDIVTGTTTTGNSQWAMKLSTPSNPTPTYPLTIENNYDSYHTVPSNYELVAKRTSATDIGSSAEGSTLTSTYQVYISNTQAAGTYTGQVKYVMVHPNNHDAPIANPAILDTGRTVNAKLKSLAATVVNGEETTITPEFDPEGGYDWDNAKDEYIKSISVHLETPAPSGFTPTEANTISSSASAKPVYIVFDNTNDAGIMHFYTEGEKIVLSSDSSFMFYYLQGLASISGISNWDTSNVTNMSSMFYEAGYSATTFSLGDLSSWDTSNVTNMSNMFVSAGRSATNWSIGDLSSWDTSNVTDMNRMFFGAGYSATTFSLGNLSSWDTSNVTNMSNMFVSAGLSATTWSIGDLSTWDTSNVTNMSWMFSDAGYFATTFSLDLSSWDTSNVTNMSSMFYEAGRSATTFSLGDLSSWDTSNVTDMSSMFYFAGRSATTWSIGDLSSWDTSNVTDMSWMFSSAGGQSATTFSIGDLSSWDTSNVTNMSSMFSSAGSFATTWSIGDLSSWDTSNVTNMSSMFSHAGGSATTWSIGDLSSWDTSNVTNMSYMFSNAGYSATSFSLDLSSWDTSNVTNMSNMFISAGRSATTFNLNLSSWDTSNVTNMSSMFNNAGSSATTWSVTIPRTNGNNINNTTNRLYGKTTSTYGTPPSGKSFTLAQ